MENETIKKLNLQGKPFYLKDEDIAWVEETYQSMSLEEKIGALFCPIGYSTDRNYLDYGMLQYHIGGMFFRDGEDAEMRDTFEYAQAHSRIPLLIPSNLEAGGNGSALNGTPFGKQMAIGASGNPEHAYHLGQVCGREGAALGINWAFAPVVDLDLNDHNPITNIRTFGKDPDKVITYAREYIKGTKENGVAACIKHFPGDGVDERDQHLLTSVNSLTTQQWDEKYGKIYQTLIDEGILSVMVGHIAMPAYEEYFDPENTDSYLPASLSPVLIKKLLREKLGFNGLVITDATPMVGFTAAMARKDAVPTAVENGCDMILFNKDLAEDYQFMLEGYQNGILSVSRLEEANIRILAMKAALGLPQKQKEGTLVPKEEALSIIHNDEHMNWTRELADESITLVKDTQGALPISPEKTKRVLLEILGDFPSNQRVFNKMQQELEKRGFTVIPYVREDFNCGVDNVKSFLEKYDMVIYIGNVENASNQTTNRLNWYTFWGQGNNVPWFANEVPTIFVSFANPYHLLDVPMIKTYINCYSNYDVVIEEAVKKLAGESSFKGTSPTDPFCGRRELHY